MEGEGNLEELPNRMRFMTWEVEKRLVISIAFNMILPGTDRAQCLHPIRSSYTARVRLVLAEIELGTNIVTGMETK